MERRSEPSAFMRMPIEIRLIIYENLLDDMGNKTLSFESEPQESYRNRPIRRRTKYHILGPGIQRRACNTTYKLITPSDFHPNFLAVSRKIHQEASYMLYALHDFEFGVHTEAIVPFLSDLTASNRTLIRSLHITKSPAVYSRDFDRCEWSNVCAFLARGMRLRKLTLRIVGGQPLRDWEPHTYSASEFRTLSRAGYDSMDWVQQLLAVKTLNELDIISDMRLCPPPSSTAMEFFAAFSASIDDGFSEYLRSEMLSAAA